MTPNPEAPTTEAALIAEARKLLARWDAGEGITLSVLIDTTKQLADALSLHAEKPEPAPVSVDEIDRIIERCLTTEGAARTLRRLITEHVRTVSEAEIEDANEAYREMLALHVKKSEEVRTLTERLDKAVEGLKKIERAPEVWADTALNKTESLCRPEATKHIARSTLASIEGDTHE